MSTKRCFYVNYLNTTFAEDNIYGARDICLRTYSGFINSVIERQAKVKPLNVFFSYIACFLQNTNGICIMCCNYHYKFKICQKVYMISQLFMLMRETEKHSNMNFFSKQNLLSVKTRNLRWKSQVCVETPLFF